MNRSPDPIAATLRAERERLDLSLSDAAHRVHLPAVVIGAYERGDRQPPLPKLRQWVEGLGHNLLAVPTRSGAEGAIRIEYAVTYGPNGDGRIECADELEAVTIAAHVVAGRVVSRVVRTTGWEPSR